MSWPALTSYDCNLSMGTVAGTPARTCIVTSVSGLLTFKNYDFGAGYLLPFKNTLLECANSGTLNLELIYS
jgi:hypothetical protein